MAQRGATQLIKNLQRFQLITFDSTDTLLRFRHPVAFVYKQAAEEMGITEISEKSLEQTFRQEFKMMSKSFPNFGSNTTLTWQQWWLQLVENTFARERPDLDSGLRALLASKLLRKYRTSECWTILPNAFELLKKVQSVGCQMGVISNFDPSIKQVLAAMNLDKFFTFILSSYDAGVQKPDRRIFDQALNLCSGDVRIPGERALHIGNTYNIDYVGARAAGWSSVLIGKKPPKTVGVDREEEPLCYENLGKLISDLETKDIQWTF